MKQIDLHTHSICSDGTLTPAALVAHAKEKGLVALALTDHDTTAGLAEARVEAKLLDIELVPGIEFSTEYKGKDIHIVGLDINEQDPEFEQELTRFRKSRDCRNQKMIDKMAADGIDISLEQMEQEFGDAVWTRAHFAKHLLNKGYIEDMEEAFQNYIGDQCKYFIPREYVTSEHAINLIRRNGGIAVLAHPLEYHLPMEDLVSMVRDLKGKGLTGIEALYSKHSQEQENVVRQLARQFGLRISGGSDYHGANKEKIDLGSGYGKLKIPYEVLENLRKSR